MWEESKISIEGIDLEELSIYLANHLKIDEMVEEGFEEILHIKEVKEKKKRKKVAMKVARKVARKVERKTSNKTKRKTVITKKSGMASQDTKFNDAVDILEISDEEKNENVNRRNINKIQENDLGGEKKTLENKEGEKNENVNRRYKNKNKIQEKDLGGEKKTLKNKEG